MSRYKPYLLNQAKTYTDEQLSNNVVDTTGSPGAKILKAGNLFAGYFDIVQPEDFVSASDVITQLGLGSAGTALNLDTPWIKYLWQNNICFTTLKPIIRSISWDSIYDAGAVYATDDEGLLLPEGRIGEELSIDDTDNSINTATQNFLGDKTSDMDYADTVAAPGDILVLKGWTNADNNGEFEVLTITNTKIVLDATLVTEAGGKQSRFFNKDNIVTQNATVTAQGLSYAARLFRGAADDPTDSYGDTDRGGRGKDNEWNWIIGQLHEQAKLKDWGNSEYMDTDLGNFGLGVTDEDLITHNDYGLGSYTWCQEVHDTASWRRVFRGYSGVSFLSAGFSWTVSSGYGLRPVLVIPLPTPL
jgi:hypothetical protein